MSLDTWYIVAQIAGVILVALTVGTAAATVVTGYFVGKGKDEQIRQHEEKIADAGKEIARLTSETERAKADAAKAQTETARVESEGKKELARVEGAAAAKIEEARAEAARQVGQVKIDLEAQRERAAKAESQLANLEKEAADAKRKQVEAELQLKKLGLGQEPRAARITHGLLKELKDKPTGKAEVIYQENDAEVFEFARELNGWLAASRWEIPFEPRPLDDMASASWKDPLVVKMLPRSMRVFASPNGLTIVANRKTIEAMDANGNIPATALQSALIALSFRVNTGVDDSLPDGFLRIVVMQKE